MKRVDNAITVYEKDNEKAMTSESFSEGSDSENHGCADDFSVNIDGKWLVAVEDIDDDDECEDNDDYDDKESVSDGINDSNDDSTSVNELESDNDSILEKAVSSDSIKYKYHKSHQFLSITLNI